MTSILDTLEWGTTRPVLHPLDRIANRISFTEADCWEWMGSRSNSGYGQMTVERKGKPVMTFSVHRASFELHEGRVPDGLQIDHICMNRACVNPAHLEPVTFAENMRRRTEKRTHCKWGHEYTPQNTRIRVREGGRRARWCLACNGHKPTFTN